MNGKLIQAVVWICSRMIRKSPVKCEEGPLRTYFISKIQSIRIVLKLQHLDNLLKNAKRLKRREEIEHIFPGIDLRIYQWSNFIDEQPIIINDTLSKKYFELGDLLSSIYGAFLRQENNSDKDS